MLLAHSEYSEGAHVALAVLQGCSAGQLAIAWVLAQGEDVVPIPGPVTYLIVFLFLMLCCSYRIGLDGTVG